MAVNKKHILNRYSFGVLLLTLIGVSVIVKASVIMFAERQYWQEVAARFVRENVSLPPQRGDLLAADGRLMSSSVPRYRIYMDFEAGGERKDTMFMNHLDEICQGLNRIFPDKSAEDFRRHLLKGRKEGRRYYAIYPRAISYIQRKEVGQLPVFNLGRYAGGFFDVTYNHRENIFGSLASRTLGYIYGDTARYGLELRYDTLLRGQEGLAHRQKVMNGYLSLPDRAPVDGVDILTTLDVDMQDICEKALVDKMEELGTATVGVVVLMEVATGDVKAIVNMTKGADGNYYERQNNAVSDMIEPGSTFKTASLMVAMEDGYITPDTEVDTENGVVKMHGAIMRDHNWHRGGYGRITATRALEVSSNVGVSRLIDKYYESQPKKFVEGLHRMGIGEDLGLEIPGAGIPSVKGPGERPFYKTDLPWMSIGYGTQIPPIYTLAFYNAIANGGVMMRPRFVKAALKDGQVVQEFPTTVVNPKICSDLTLERIQYMLRRVVSHGLAKAAACQDFDVSGKTGTAQISQGAAGYKTGRTRYLVSFCGYFPTEKPKYSMIVAIQKNGLPASGGLMAGSVFSRIAERVYTMGLYVDAAEAADSTSVTVPTVKAGSLSDAVYVLDRLNVNVLDRPNTSSAEAAWGTLAREETGVRVQTASAGTAEGLVPNVIGMGAKDAVYLMEKAGLRVSLSGVGRVKRQSIGGGSRATRGSTVHLSLSRN